MKERAIALQLRNVVKAFTKGGKTVRAVDNVNLDIEEGEMVCFLGPSGCGKTTTLRMVAGFETPTSGVITIKGKDVTNVPVNKRGIGFVFQNYALFPHMSVANNIAYGLKTRHIDPVTIAEKTKEALELVGLPNVAERYPSELSGGEQQRVALARVLVMEPSLLLMDEPLSNLDAKLRIHMRTEIRHLQKKLGITCLYVTHDQSEALTVADKIVVIRKGVVQQVGSPREIYHNPANAFVADFIGQANILPLQVVKADEHTVTVEPAKGHPFTTRKGAGFSGTPDAGTPANLVIRPENIDVLAASSEGIPAKVVSAIFVGSHIEYELSIEGIDKVVNASVPSKPEETVWDEGEAVKLHFDNEAALVVAS
jgi:iron(III) transport system ATP-binding protein